MSIISSRTPEGLPNECPICGASVIIEPSFPPGDAPCPACGQLLWWFQERLASRRGVDPRQILLDGVLTDEMGDSIDLVEFVMELEEEFDVTISDEDASRIETVREAIAFIRAARRDRREE
jgi:acyl carrier protein